MSGGAPAMDLGYLLDEIMVGVTPLDWQRVLDRWGLVRGAGGGGGGVGAR
jgi:hypothetical protein